jgi:hypothetical protein
MSTSKFSPTSDRPRHPDLEADWGEDPARFLSCSEHYLPVARIKGIQDPGLLSAYRAVELKHWGGRDVIMDAIAKREREIELEGSYDGRE